MDDMLIMSNDIANINVTKHMLTSKLDMKDFGVGDLILGIKIHKTPQGLALSQSHYIQKVLKKFKYLDFKVAKTPIDVNLALAKNKGQNISQLDYDRMLGCLMYIINCTRLDIACAISKLNRYTNNLGQSHWMGMKRVLGYLNHTQDFALHYSNYLVVIEGYCDASLITGSTDSKSTGGYVFTIGGGAVSWKSPKQMSMACSTMEAEFIALDKAGEESE
ncbi:secreted RxLR effector protein 161-like [Nicotiana sylvestris]|uniref:secreted RxLR effector protein 161-like n=1 Tax=Nicotiana sylvestris TaxID=4096 RepID=UPI00388C3681